MKDAAIPLHKPWINSREVRAAEAALKAGKIAGAGPFGAELESRLKQYLGTNYAFLVTSCTHALELSLMLLGVGPGDEILCPSFAFVSAATAIVRTGAKPVFVDIDPRTYNIQTADLQDHISPRTRAIIVIHYAGQVCNMDKILQMCKSHSIACIEDAAHAIGSRYNGRHAGNLGDFGCFSFHATKNITCGEGGAIIVKAPRHAERAEIMREKGTNRAQFLRGAVQKYLWVDEGSSFVLSDILAAIALEQFKKVDKINALRTQKADYFNRNLEGLQPEIILPIVEPCCGTNWHIYAIRVKASKRDEILDALRKQGIGAAFHFLPLHLSPYARAKWGYSEGDFPATEEVSRTLIRLPIYPQLTVREMKRIVSALKTALLRES